MLKFRTMAILALWVLPAAAGRAQSRSAIDKSTDVAALLPVAAGVTASLIERDYDGLGRLALSGATALALNYSLEALVRKNRPDGSGRHAFPSTHSVAAFSGATFLMRRYGWRWGVPAYAVSAYVAWGRVFARKHDVWDVLGGAAIGAGCALIYTRPLARKADLTLTPTVAADGGAGFYAALRF